VIGLVLVGVGGLARLRVNAGAESFLPSGDPTVLALEENARRYGADPVVVVLESAPDELLGPKELPRLLGLEGQLARLPDVSVVYGPGTALNQVAAEAQDLVARISGRRDALRTMAEQQARATGAGPAGIAEAVARATAEFDLRYGQLLVEGLPAGLPTLRNPSFVRTVLLDASGEPRPRWRFVVPSRNAVAILVRPREHIDQEATERVVRAVRDAAHHAGLPASRITVSGAPAVSAELAGQMRSEVPLLGSAALIVVGLCLLVTGPSGGRRRRLVPLLVAVVVTGLELAVAGWLRVPLSLGLVTFLPVLFGIASYYPLYLAHRAQRRQVIVAGTASACAFAALGVSPLPFVRELGLALAAGVLASIGVSIVALRFVPSMMRTNSPKSTAEDSGRVPAVPPRATRTVALLMLGLLAALGWFMLPRLDVDADPQKLADGLAALSEVQHTEQVLGSSGEVSVVLTGPDVLTPDAVRWSRSAQSVIALAHGDSLQPIISVADLFRFLGEEPTQQEIMAATQLIPHYLEAAAVSDDRRSSILSLGIRLQ
jgi:predicted RND superfamily exporter protein